MIYIIFIGGGYIDLDNHNQRDERFLQHKSRHSYYYFARPANALIFVINLSYMTEIARNWHHQYDMRQQLSWTRFEFIRVMLRDIWKVIDIFCTGCIFIGTVLRNAMEYRNSARMYMASASVLMAFRLIYFFRAFERTGKVVAYMIKIVKGIGFFLLILALIIIGFAYGFWILTANSDSIKEIGPNLFYNASKTDSKPINTGFRTLDGAMVTTFAYMMGQYSAEEFADFEVNQFTRILYVLLVIITSIIMLNLLITIMGDIYQGVNANSRGQFLWEQANVLVNLMPNINGDQRKKTNMKVLHCLKVTRSNENDMPPTAQDFGAPANQVVVVAPSSNNPSADGTIPVKNA